MTNENTTVKLKYLAPEMEIITFECDDIIITSDGTPVTPRIPDIDD